MNDPNHCDLALEDVVAHLDGELDAVASARVAGHLEGCPPCAREAGLLTRAGAALSALPGISPSAGFTERVLAATRAAPAAAAAPVPSMRGRLMRLWPAAAVAAALVAALLLNRADPGSTTVDTREMAGEMTEAEILAIAADLPLLVNLDALKDDADAAGLIALIENLDLLESVEAESLDALDALIRDAEDGG